MVVILFTFGFFMMFLVTKSYKYCCRYYSTIQYVSLVGIAYPLICRGYMVWHFPNRGMFSDKINELFQAAVLFPTTTVLFLRYLPHRIWTRTLYFLGFFGIFAVMEWLMVLRKEIFYEHGWSYGWSLFVDFCLFALMWIHAKSRVAALMISLCILIFLVIWFRVPVDG